MYEWNILSEYDESKKILGTLLLNRGIVTIEAQEEFLNSPKIIELFSKFPNEFKDSLLIAKKHIIRAMENSTPILIHGDYDADGICATAILYKTLKEELGYERTYFFIPNRFDHGYGLSENSIKDSVELISKSLGDKPTKILFITVDSGITAVVETALIKDLGFDVIITDHHKKPSELPNADCIVWNDQIVGSTISWFLSRTIGSKNIQNVELAAIATVTDLQPLLGFNRVLVKKGLYELNTNIVPGIKALIDVAGKSSAEITTYDLGWVIGPRLNASGRLFEASDAIKLLIETDIGELNTIASSLNEVNVARQDKTLEMFELAQDTDVGDLNNKVIFSSNTGYHEGIIGLVAARLVQKHYKPAIVISLGDMHGKGSVRSIPGVDIIAFLRKFEDLFLSLGGHPMAAGFSIKNEHIPTLKELINKEAETYINESQLHRVLNIDMLIPSEIININFLEDLDRLKPYGNGNEEPVFAIKDIGVAGVSVMGKNATHLLIKLFDNKKFYKAVYFGGVANTDIKIGDRIDIAFTLKRNEFNGTTTVDLIVKDLNKKV